MSNESETGIILHQIKLTDEMVDFLNGKDGGWTNASKKYEAVEAHLECGSINGADNWEPRFWKHYRAVAKIHTDKLEDAFGIGNAYGGAHMDMVEKGLLTPLLPLISFREGHETVDMHSMSVGDICEMDGKHYMCHRVGFTEIQITDDAYWEKLHDEHPERFDENGIYHPPNDTEHDPTDGTGNRIEA